MLNYSCFNKIGLALLTIMSVQKLNAENYDATKLVFDYSDAAKVIERDTTLSKDELVNELEDRAAKARILVENVNPELLTQYDQASEKLINDIKDPAVTKEQILQQEVEVFKAGASCGENYIYGITREFAGYIGANVSNWNPGLWGIYLVTVIYDTAALPFQVIGTIGSCLSSK